MVSENNCPKKQLKIIKKIAKYKCTSWNQQITFDRSWLKGNLVMVIIRYRLQYNYAYCVQGNKNKFQIQRKELENIRNNAAYMNKNQLEIIELKQRRQYMILIASYTQLSQKKGERGNIQK